MAKSADREHPHLVLTALESCASKKAAEAAKAEGASVTVISPITTGRVEVAMVEEALTGDTVLVSVTTANGVTGTSEPYTGLGSLTSGRGIALHLDAGYAYGRMPINVDRSHIDLLSADAASFGGPEGVGFLYARTSTGAGKFLSDSAIDADAVSAMADVAGEKAAAVPDFMKNCSSVRARLFSRIFDEIMDVELVGHKAHHTANHLAVRIKGVSAAVVKKEMADAGIFVLSGTGAPILRAIGMSDAEAEEVVIFSMTSDVTAADVDTAVQKLKDIVTGQRVIL